MADKRKPDPPISRGQRIFGGTLPEDMPAEPAGKGRDPNDIYLKDRRWVPKFLLTGAGTVTLKRRDGYWYDPTPAHFLSDDDLEVLRDWIPGYQPGGSIVPQLKGVLIGDFGMNPQNVAQMSVQDVIAVLRRKRQIGSGHDQAPDDSPTTKSEAQMGNSDADPRAPYFPSGAFLKVKSDTLAQAGRRGRITRVKRKGRWHYSWNDAHQVWPNLVPLDPPRP